LLKHIVMFRMQKDSKDKKIVINTFKDKLESLKNKIPQLKKVETVVNIRKRSDASNLVLATEFKNEHDLQIYRVRPNHQNVIAFIQEIASDAVVVN